MGKIKIQDMVGKDYHFGAGDYKVSMLELAYEGYHLPSENDKRIPLNELVNKSTNIIKGEVKLSDLIKRHIPPVTSREEREMIEKSDDPDSEYPVCGGCGKIITGNEIAYSPQYREAYHPKDGCIQSAMVRRAFTGQEVVFSNIEYLTRK